MTRLGCLALSIAAFLSACSPAPLAPSPSAAPAASATNAPTAIPPSETPTVTPTPDPYAGLTLLDLAARTYGGGSLREGEALADALDYTRYAIDYDSDGLRVFGFLDRPHGGGPFPVVLVLHGYVPTEGYSIQTYTARYAAWLARLGFLVIHTNYRNYPPSDVGPNLFRVGYAIDVLNLAAIVRAQAGEPGPLESADGARIGLFGHSMGGGIALRVITIDPEIRAAVLYGSMSGNERWNYEKILEWSDGERGLEEWAVPDADMVRIGAIEYLDRIEAAVSIHHGAADPTVPPEWSADLCARLEGLGRQPECFSYPGQPHTFYGDTDAQFMGRVGEFFNRTLR
ncbi:MAG: alpha/beta fold hydrolase [Anaerolineales bacterium]